MRNTSCHFESTIDLLRCFKESKNLKLGRALHAQFIRSYDFDLIKANHLIDLYARCGRINLARSLFDEMPHTNTVSCTALMAGYLHQKSPLQALSLLKSINFNNYSMCLNEYMITTALSCCSAMQAIEEGRQCHAFATKSGLFCYSYVRNVLLHFYSRCRLIEEASKVFQTVDEFDVYAYNSMINAYLEHGNMNTTFDLLKRMIMEVAQWDEVTYVAVLGICSDTKNLQLGCQAHSHVKKRGMLFSEFVGSAMVDMYGKCGDLTNAMWAFDALKSRNVVSWTAVIAIFAQNELFEEALKLFLKMNVDGVRPNEFTFSIALSSCAGLSGLRTGHALNACAEKLGYKTYLNVGNALIFMYCKSGSIEDATTVFTGLPQRDIISWNSIITGFSQYGLSKDAMEAFNNMLKEGIFPSYVTFVGVLSACANLALKEEGFYYLETFMPELGIKPGLEHHTCIVGLLCRAGKLDEAERYMQTTRIEWDLVAWRTLLTACQVYKNYGLGWRVAEYILQLNSDDVGTCILLSNMFAKAGRWDGVVKIRKLMKLRDKKKEPGVSWIEAKNETHVFSSEDKKHPLMNQICHKMRKLLDEIKLLGYVPNITSVLHDVEDEQKEEYLMYHSEKLALAFGLLALPPGAPIYVIKNLRMCDDCHTFIKLISTTTRRKIVVRDINRFHRFEAGNCSCDDYW